MIYKKYLLPDGERRRYMSSRFVLRMNAAEAQAELDEFVRLRHVNLNRKSTKTRNLRWIWTSGLSDEPFYPIQAPGGNDE